MVYELGSGSLIRWSFFSELSCNAPKALIITNIFARGYCFNSTSVIMGNFMNSWKTHLTWLQDTWIKLAGSKQRSSVIVHFKTFYWREIFMRQIVFLCTGKWGEFWNSKNWQRVRKELITKPLHLSWRGRDPHKNIPSCATLERYNKIPIFIPIDITEDAVKSVTQKIWNWKLYMGGF